MSDLHSTIESADAQRSKTPWIVGAVVIALVAAIVFFVVRGDAADGGDGELVRGGTLEFGLIDFQRSPDPHWGTNYAESIIAGNVTDKLLWQDPDTAEVTPWLAESWEFNDGLTEFTFQLRDDVTFSDGEPFNAEAVKANYDQYINGDTELGINPNGAPLFPGYVETRVDDEFAVTLIFDAPLASALQAVSFTANAGPGFLSPNTLALNAEERSDPTRIIGTGPFVYESWEEQVSTVLVKREGYDWAPEALDHEGEAYLDKIVFNTIPEASVRTGSLASGSLDATLDVGTTDEAPLADQGFEIISRTVSGTAIVLDLNASLFPTNDLAVRRAVQLGWNRENIEQTVLTDSYSIATSVLGDSVQGYQDYSDGALRFDPDEAESILEDAGWVAGADGIREKDGRKLEIKLLGISNLVANRPSYESVQQDLREIGIDLQLTVVPIPDFAAQSANAATEWNVTASNRSRNDPSVLGLRYSPDLGNSSQLSENAPGIDLDHVREVFAAVESTLDPAQRSEAAGAAQDLLIEEYALVNPVYFPSQVIAHADYVHGIVFDAQARNNFVDTWKDSDA